MGHGGSHDDGPLDGPDEEPREDPFAHLDRPDDPAGGPPHPLDRLWVHPTEFSSFVDTPAAPPAPARPRGAPGWLVPMVAGAAGAVIAIVVLALTGTLDRSPAPAGSSSAPNHDGAATAADVAAGLNASVVALSAHDAKGTRRGSGVCIRHGGEIVTSANVVGTATSVDVVDADGHHHVARVLGRDVVTDVAVVQVTDAADMPAAPLADAAATTGDHVWVYGRSAAGTTPWMSGGTVASANTSLVRSAGPMTAGLVQTDAASTTDAEGGALVDDGAKVAAIVLGRLDDSGTTYALPIAAVTDVAAQLRATGHARHGSLGFEGTDTASGPAVVKVTGGGPAATAGLRAGDRIDAIGGTAVGSMDDVMALVRSRAPGATVALKVHRGTTPVTLSVVLGGVAG